MPYLIKSRLSESPSLFSPSEKFTVWPTLYSWIGVWLLPSPWLSIPDTRHSWNGGFLQHFCKMGSLVTYGHGRGELGMTFPLHIPQWDIPRHLAVSFPRNSKELRWSTLAPAEGLGFGQICSFTGDRNRIFFQLNSIIGPIICIGREFQCLPIQS